MKKSAFSYSVTRRRFLRDATLTSLGIVAAACTPGGTSPSASPSGGTSAKGGEFHGAWPYDLPPKGHYNYFAAAGIILQGAIYVDLFQPRRAEHPARFDPSGLDLRHDRRQGGGPLRGGQGQHRSGDRGAPRREGKPSAGPDVGRPVHDRQELGHRSAAHHDPQRERSLRE